MSAIGELLQLIDGSHFVIAALKQENAQWQTRCENLQQQYEAVRSHDREASSAREDLQKEVYKLKQQVKSLEQANTGLIQRLKVAETEDGLPDVDPDQSDNLLAESIDVLDIGVKTYNALKRSNINTVGDVCQRRATELLRVRNFGRWCLNDLNYALGLHKLNFACEEDPYDQIRIQRVLTSSRARLMHLEDLGLSVETYNEVLKNTAFPMKTVYDILERYYSEKTVRERFSSSEYADELLEELKSRDFYLR